MIVLSLFDGMACGYEALKQAGVPVTKYYASEIDKYAIQIAKKNHPDIIHLGDVTDWKEWDIEPPDLIMGGSPCQGFSFAGKQLAFDDPRSKLFFTMIDIIDNYKPQYKLLENVKMKKEYLDTITEYMGVEPLFINSALVSAQNRQRYYWYNWGAPLPEDRGILLKDIVEGGTTNYVTGGGVRGRYIVDGKRQDHKMKTAGLTTQRLEVRKDGKTNTLTTVQKDNVCVEVFKKEHTLIEIGKADIKGYDITKRVYSPEGKCPSLLAVSGGHQEKKVSTDGLTWRKLTPIECERLQTIPDNYTEGVSNTQRYKMLGNGWTVDVVAHLFKYILQ